MEIKTSQMSSDWILDRCQVVINHLFYVATLHCLVNK